MDFTRRCAELHLFERFVRLRGGDLIYACIAKLEDIGFVTFDHDFAPYASEIHIIDPAA